MAERIVWNNGEKSAVAAESFRIQQADKSLSVIAAVSQAQQAVLPENRRRPVHQAKDFERWLTPLWDAMRTEAAHAPKRAEARRKAEALFTPEIVQVEQPDIPAPVASGTPEGTTEPPPVVEPDDARPSSTEAAPVVEIIQKASKPRTSVFWRDDEKRKVAVRAYANLERWPDMSKLEAFRKAQDSELPEDRRRNLSTWETIREWAEPMLESIALDVRIEEARQHEENERRREAERAEAAEREAAKLRAEAAEREQARAFEVAVQSRMDTLTLDDMFKAMARRMAREMVSAFSAEIEGVFVSKMHSVLSEALGGPPTAAPPPTRQPEPPARIVESNAVKLPKVCVVGLLNRTQEDDVEKAFLGAVEFVFVKSQGTGGNGGGGKGMLDKAQKCDVVVGMIDFAGHGVDEAAKKLHDIPYKRVAGSVSALKRWLRIWLDEALQKAA